MRQFNRLLGFVAVSFVLLFMGRVNKTGLYTAYFRTIADVEIRNSQAMDHGDAHFVATSPQDSKQQRTNGLPLGSASFASLNFEQFGVVPTIAICGTSFNHSNAVAMRCFAEVAPRAPGA